MSQNISARWRLTALPSLAAAALPASGGEVMSTLTIEPIGHIESPFLEPAGTPLQPSRAEGARGRVLLREKYLDGLRDLEGFERIWLVYWLHKASPGRLTVTPFLDQTPRGVFATRSPARPSPLGMSAVRLTGIRNGALEIADVDVINGTPLLDIKPYVPEFDSFPGSRAGWFDQSRSGRRKADGRFVPDTPGAPGKP